MSLLSNAIPGWGTSPQVGATRLGVVPGEGIGPEVVGAALTVLRAAATQHGLDLDVVHSGPIGGPGPHGLMVDSSATDFYDDAFAAGIPVLTGPAGGRFVYELRAHYDLYAKLIPVQPLSAIADASIVRPDRLPGIDILIVRDNSAGLYQGAFGRRDEGRTAYQEATYTAEQVDRIVTVAARAAATRRGRLAIVTKPGGIPELSALWQERAQAVVPTEIELEMIEVDNAAYQLVADPQRFDVVVTANMLGDVLGDTAAVALGSRGMAYSANFGSSGHAVFQTAHGAAHDLAGRDVANPVAQMLSMVWLLREACGQEALASTITRGLVATLEAGIRTSDVAGPSSVTVGTREFADAVASRITTADREVVAS